jgi:putative transcriptional regulator
MDARSTSESALSPAFLTGRALIAMPGIDDPRFERAVVLICAHNADHAMGLVINRPIDDLTVPTVLDRLGVTSQIELPPDLVLLGGPVERERGFVVHTSDYLCPDTSTAITDALALTATKDVLEAMASHNRRPRRSLLALGYAGWGAGQLERELRDNIWLACDPDEALLFGHDFDHKWSMALARLGVSPSQLAIQAGMA